MPSLAYKDFTILKFNMEKRRALRVSTLSLRKQSERRTLYLYRISKHNCFPNRLILLKCLCHQCQMEECHPDILNRTAIVHIKRTVNKISSLPIKFSKSLDGLQHFPGLAQTFG